MQRPMHAPPVSPTLRDALVAAMLPSPGGGLPGAGDVDLTAFWPRFEAAAPIHLRLAFRAATVIIAGILPITLGYRKSLAKLDENTRDTVLQTGAKMATIAPLLEIVKIVVAFAYFDNAQVEAIVRGRA